VLEGLLRIHVVLLNPFGEDPCDFPTEMFLGDIWLTSQYLGQERDIPFQRMKLTANRQVFPPELPGYSGGSGKMAVPLEPQMLRQRRTVKVEAAAVREARLARDRDY